MKAEALIGRALGTCTLQKLVGQGGMGAVYLAQQSRPRRQVAVKVLLPITQLNANQLAAFLERFRRETDAAASLEHPNIMPVHEYGEQAGIAYLVMPYVSGGTLRDELEREGPLTLQKTMDYLDQLSAALDFAHEHGVIHRDIKPANIMVTNEGRLILSDFGLVKIIAAGQAPQVRLTGAGAPVGTPDYMAPEQVIGEEVDTRADLYSLGVILFQMLTGTTPFQGETPMQIAAQHLQIPPPSPQMLRPDLPIAAEQVVLRAMAKRPGDRFMRAEDMARAFRNALLNSGIQIGAAQTWAGLLSGSTASRMAVPKGQFDPMRQTASMPKVTKADLSPRATGNLLNRAAMPPMPPAQNGFAATNQNNPSPRATGGLLSRTGMMASVKSNAAALDAQPRSGLLSRTGKSPMTGTDNDLGSGLHPSWNRESPQTPTALPGNGAMMKTPTNALALQETRTSTGTLKLNDPVKVVKVPVAGQPGQYITGILPFERQPEEEEKPQKQRKAMKPWMPTALAAAAVIVVLASLGILLFFQNQSKTVLNGQQSLAATANAVTPDTPGARATAQAIANILVTDPLDKNNNGWRTNPANLYSFKNGAYHIAVQGDKGSGAILPGKSYDGPITYRLTMQEIKGNDNDAGNTFGMIFRFNQQNKNGKTNTTFYTFEVANTKGKEYKLWRYDDSQTNPWTTVKNGTLAMGNEFHLGKQANTIEIAMNADKFTVTVNGKKLPKVFQDNTYKNGTVGMTVNMNGTEVAFKNLLLTRN
ncbi:hypothetical protein KDW_12270 [Dictyobacter vulcani]|uniref:non-specific serine/threonine protein kinase n=1 Tax=Dictyobacter vulcani TaxID=2607529 RepID=A0A5J4KHF8_9CHLR|nr:serine/threonine-protein kinase [Dictyobacter vulcani]GER87065.1 hypothetical protein KDW_12270 [Dictyobacter vulcani]